MLKIILLVLFSCLNSWGNTTTLFAPKLFAKFSLGYDALHINRDSKIGGSLAFENEFSRHFSAGVSLGASLLKIKSLEINDFSNPDTRATRGEATLFDIGIYLKPQLPFDKDWGTIIPYLSFMVGFPSFSKINGKNKEKVSPNFVLSQFYSAALGVDLIWAHHWIFLAEVGAAVNLRLINPYIVVVPITMTAGLGYRF